MSYEQKVKSLTDLQRERLTNYVHNIALATGVTPAAVSSHLAQDAGLFAEAIDYTKDREVLIDPPLPVAVE